MTYQEALYWIRQEAAIDKVDPKIHVQAILIDYAEKQREKAHKVIPISNFQRPTSHG